MDTNKTRFIVENYIFTATNWCFWRDIQQAIFSTWKQTCVTVVFSSHFRWCHKIFYLLLQNFSFHKPWSNIIPEKLFSIPIRKTTIGKPKQLSLQINLFRNKWKVTINSQGYYSGTRITEVWNKSDNTTGPPETSGLCLWCFDFTEQPLSPVSSWLEVMYHCLFKILRSR